MNRALLGFNVVGSVVYGIASAASVSTSPLSVMGGVAGTQASDVQTVDYRRCWWDDMER
jgi:hypothetical protein